MARSNRKLFPNLTTTNQTLDCPDFCDPACPYSYNCYPYSDTPPPPPIPAAGSTHISPYLIVGLSSLAILLFFVTFYIIIIKVRAFRTRQRERVNGPPTPDSGDEFIDENRVDHPLWFITTAGLQPSVINAITICRYKRGDGLIEGTECSVCLNEFRDDELVRLLPKCSHAFHISCIDAWLRSHTNCPLCRAHIVTGSGHLPPQSNHENRGNMVLEVDEGGEGHEERDSGNGVGEILADEGDENVTDSKVNLKPEDHHECGSDFGRSSERTGSCSSSVIEYVQESPVKSMKRSVSCNGRFFSTRQNPL